MDSCVLRNFMNLAEYIDSRREEHLEELCSFLRIPSVSAKTEHKQDVERGARWVAESLRAAGFKTIEIIPTNLHPLVYAESLEAPGKPTVLFYGHYDVQPAEPLELCTSPAFEPTVGEGNLSGRGADTPPNTRVTLCQASRQEFPRGRPGFLRFRRQTFSRGTQSFELSAVERKST